MVMNIYIHIYKTSYMAFVHVDNLCLNDTGIIAKHI